MGGAQGDRRQGFAFADHGWTLVVTGEDADREGWAGTILALSNGSIGVRGSIEERAQASTFLAGAYEQSPIHYHERLHGFADGSDTRVPVAEPLGLRVLVDSVGVDFAAARHVETVRALDLRAGILRRRSCWQLADGRGLTIHAERIVPIDGTPVLLRRLRAEIDGAAVTLEPFLAPAPRAIGRSDDPRIGAHLASGGFRTEHAEEQLIVERLPGSGIGVATAQRVARDGDWTVVATGFAVGTTASDALRIEAETCADHALGQGFDAAAAVQRDTFATFWRGADVSVDSDPETSAALRVNLFHLFTSAGRDGRSSAAAKGLTGEGYEGHYFWDTEAFMLPVLALVAPEVARGMLVYRFRTLDAARSNARALDHECGALYAWRTIAGRECSAHYPSGSAQYHINAAIGFAIGLYADASGDDAFLFEMGAEMLIETARLWIALGDWHADRFHIHGVTGPDEYTALVDDNWYTNRMAQKHLRLARRVAEHMRGAAPGAWAALSRKLALRDEELDGFGRAADAMHLPFDSQLQLDAQDASFLAKPRWDLDATPGDRFPLLLHYHPMTLYRHQVCKQADLVLGMVLGGEEVSGERKRRVFDYYEPITTHDSTLSASSFAILASEIGELDAALRFFRDTSFVDLEDQHGNTDHGVHMASLAGSWLALVWGFGGFRPSDEGFGFRPQLPPGWTGYRFGMRWHGSEMRVSVNGEEARYELVTGAALRFAHNGAPVELEAGQSWSGALAR